MKIKFRCLTLMVLLFTITNSLMTQWVQTGPYGGQVTSMVVNGTNFIIGTNGGGIFLSPNNGTSWSAIDTGLTNPYVIALAITGQNLFAAVNLPSGVYLSTNNGMSWSAVNHGLEDGYPQWDLYCLAVSGSNVFAGTDGRIFYSANNGTSWGGLGTEPPGGYITALAVSGSVIFAGTQGLSGVNPYTANVRVSTDNGTSWNSNFPPLVTDVNTLFISNAYVFAGIHTGGGPTGYRSGSNGLGSWSDISPSKTNAVNCFATYGPYLFAGTYPSGVFLSTNNGTTWKEVDSSLNGGSVSALAVCGTFLFAGTSKGVWRRPLSEITSVNHKAIELPKRFSLEQNYPNPFNPTTTISFSIPIKSFVSLKVYDAVGREVSLLISEELSAGSYSRQWNATNLPSGIYFYRLRAASFNKTQKLILQK